MNYPLPGTDCDVAVFGPAALESVPVLALVSVAVLALAEMFARLWYFCLPFRTLILSAHF